MVQGPPRGYFLEPNKNILVMSPRNIPRAEDLFRGYGIQIVMGSRYIGVLSGIPIIPMYKYFVTIATSLDGLMVCNVPER